MATLEAGAGQYHQDDQTPGIYTRFKNMDNSEMAEAMGLSTEDKVCDSLSFTFQVLTFITSDKLHHSGGRSRVRLRGGAEQQDSG